MIQNRYIIISDVLFQSGVWEAGTVYYTVVLLMYCSFLMNCIMKAFSLVFVDVHSSYDLVLAICLLSLFVEEVTTSSKMPWWVTMRITQFTLLFTLYACHCPKMPNIIKLLPCKKAQTTIITVKTKNGCFMATIFGTDHQIFLKLGFQFTWPE